jgi:hypothetical protein
LFSPARVTCGTGSANADEFDSPSLRGFNPHSQFDRQKKRHVVAKDDLNESEINALLEQFSKEFTPFEVSAEGAHGNLYAFHDGLTGAWFCECNVPAQKLVTLGTVDVPLDPDEQPEYRANRKIVESSSAFEKMKDDARNRRNFSNIVAEYTKEFDEDHPLKIIGGQHRFEAIRLALDDRSHRCRLEGDLHRIC